MYLRDRVLIAQVHQSEWAGTLLLRALFSSLPRAIELKSSQLLRNSKLGAFCATLFYKNIY